MRALEPEVFDAVWTATEPLIPATSEDPSSGCHRPRVSDGSASGELSFGW